MFLLANSTCRNGGRTRRGLTLLELVVVIAILAALAGILVPLLPSLLNKTHASTGATNLGEIAKAIQLYASQNGDNYPNNLDSIVAGSSIASYVPNGNPTLGVPGSLIAGPLNANDVAALNGSGINQMAQMMAQTNDGNWSPTFNPYDVAPPATAPTITAVTTSTTVAFLDPAVAASKLGATLTSAGTGTGTAADYQRFVVFGLGKYASCCGQTMDEAPVWYNPTAGQDPDSVYARFGLVFQTTDSAGNALARAKLIGVVEFATWGTMTKDDNLSYYYSLK